MEQNDLPLIRQYQAWLQIGDSLPDAEREPFFTKGLVVLDTNLLLNLYEYTPSAREQVLAALELIAPRLWLPYQVGLEFIRGRHRVIANRVKTLTDAPDAINHKLNEARRAVVAARDAVKNLLLKYAQDDEAGAELDKHINQQSFDDALADWRSMLLNHIKKLKAQQDLKPGSVASDDKILPRIAALFGDRIGVQPPPEVLRRRVEEASAYRFPNEIPPGFRDAGKETPLRSAGDFLLWEEIVEKAAGTEGHERVLLVSADAKEDWYEPAEQGRGPRPWPILADELRLRADASLRIETPRQFYQGIKQFLDADLTENTYEEIDRAAEPREPEGPLITETEALVTDPPDGLALAAYRAAGLATSAIRKAIESPSQRLFQWWLIGVTRELGRREAQRGEPPVELPAAICTDAPPAPHWERGTALKPGEWPYRASSWLAPWFLQVVYATPDADRQTLLRLAVRQADPSR
ncbi:PIN-like domain-containing protein [Streptomyces cylindrosporus]|uniref:PIN-like domain-containing protein n=1 Tax=Streptomyces cylindrosporus TaxID=2927583 RepID=A0ABS9YGY5_9ACTN|nr:PIN-like domain-containing protein [Streptomyces cylindrosporus]MCI3276483.1 PIN-like domain-containing protein [Streptomyces cylindrosporus]